MKIQECMTRKVQVANPQMNLIEIARKMDEGDFGFMPIGEKDRLVGVITDRDIATRAVAMGLDPKTTLVRDVCSNKVLYCFEDQTVEDVAHNMGDNQVRRLPVLNREKRLVGVVSLGDLARSANSEADTVEEALCEISKPGRHGEEARPVM